MNGAETAQDQYESDPVRLRDLDILNRIEAGERRKDIAASLRVSYSRVSQLYERAMKWRRLGVI